jgi:hypothetical protein
VAFQQYRFSSKAILSTLRKHARRERTDPKQDTEREAEGQPKQHVGAETVVTRSDGTLLG